MNFSVVGVGILAACFFGSAQAEPASSRVCYSTAEAREKIAANGLSDPFRLVRGATRSVTAEVVGVKLCLWSERLVYEVSLLPRDGHIDRVFIDARTGEIVVPRAR